MFRKAGRATISLNFCDNIEIVSTDLKKQKLITFVAVIFLLIGLLAQGTGNNAQAQGWECPDPAPEVTLKRIVTKTKLYRTKDIHMLTDMHAADGAVILEGMHVNGLGGGRIGLEGLASFSIMQRGAQACIWLKSLDAKFFAMPRIHIARNFRKNTCEFDAVLEHEKIHIRVLKDFHEEYAPHFKRELNDIVAALPPQGPMNADHIDAAQEEMNRYINQRIKAYNDRIMQILSERQDAVDTPEEYARVNAQCRDWHKYY